MNKQFQYELYGSKLLPVSHIISSRGTSVVAWNNKLNKNLLTFTKEVFKELLNLYYNILLFISFL